MPGLGIHGCRNGTLKPTVPPCLGIAEVPRHIRGMLTRRSALTMLAALPVALAAATPLGRAWAQLQDPQRLPGETVDPVDRKREIEERQRQLDQTLENRSRDRELDADAQRRRIQEQTRQRQLERQAREREKMRERREDRRRLNENDPPKRP